MEEQSAASAVTEVKQEQVRERKPRLTLEERMRGVSPGKGGVQNEEKFQQYAAAKGLSVAKQETEQAPKLVRREPAKTEQTSRIPILNEASSEKVLPPEESVEVKENAIPESESEESITDEPLAEEENQEESQEDDNQPPEQKALRGYAEKKIGKLTKKVHDANAVVEALKEELQNLRRQQSELPSVVPTVNEIEFVDPNTMQVVSKPKASDYGSNTTAFIEALDNFRDHKDKAFKFWQIKYKDMLEGQRIEQEYGSKIQKGREVYSDFVDVINRASPRLESLEKAQPCIIKPIQSSPYAEHIVYHISKNPDLQDELASSSPEKALIKIGRLEGAIEMGMKPSNVVSKAPPPIKAKPSPSPSKVVQTIPKDASQKSQREWNASMKDRMRRGR